MGEKRKGSKAELREIPIFQELAKENTPAKEVELEKPKRLKTSGDSDVIDAKGFRLGLHLLLPDEEVDLEGLGLGLTDGRPGALCSSRRATAFVAKAEFGG